MQLPNKFSTQKTSLPFIPKVSLTQLIAQIAKSYRLDCIETEILLIVMSENKSGQDIRESLGNDLKYPRVLIDICEKLGIPTEINLSIPWEHYLKSYFQERISMLTGLDFKSYQEWYKSIGCGSYLPYFHELSQKESILSKLKQVTDTIHNPQAALTVIKELEALIERTCNAPEEMFAAFQDILLALPNFVKQIATTSEFSTTDVSLLLLNEIIFTLRREEKNSLTLQEEVPAIKLFIGRQQEFRDLDEAIASGVETILVTGPGGIGKSTLCRQYLQQNFETYLEFPTDRETSDLIDIKTILEEKLKEIGEVPGETFKASFAKLKNRLHSTRIGILINNLDSVIDQDGNFIPRHRRYLQLIRFLGQPDTQAVTFITSRHRLINIDVGIAEYSLRGLSINDWRVFFSTSGMHLKNQKLKWIHKMFAGSAREMEALLGKYHESSTFDILSYCLERVSPCNSLQRLVELELDELQLSAEDSSYKLLMRIGCYQTYEDSMPLSSGFIKALAWDIPDEEQQEIITNFVNRSLLTQVHSTSEYTVHSSVLAEAYRRLSDDKDWLIANRKIAEYWTRSVPVISDPIHARRALEAYYYYVVIQDYESAADVLIQKRKNCFNTDESLARSLYKLGFKEQLEEAIDKLRNELIPGYRRAKLIHTLGALSWLKGDIHKAISHCDEAIILAQQSLDASLESEGSKDGTIIRLREIELNANLTKGLCSMGLGELDIALQVLEHVVDLSKRLDYSKYSPSANFYIAYILSFKRDIKSRTRALSIANHLFTLYEKMSNESMPSWITEYRLYHLGLAFTNLGEYEKAFLIHQRVLKNKQCSLYQQAKTKHYNGLACYYRELKMLDKAVHFHNLAITSFKEINAWVDLAEAYFQEAITRRETGEIALSLERAMKAVQLFDKMNAQKQKERVLGWSNSSFNKDFVI